MSTVGDPKAKLPRPPPDLDAAGKTLFRAVVTDLVRRQALAGIDAATIARFCRADQLAREARQEVANLRQAQMPIFQCKDSIAVMVRAEQDADRYGQRLGLDPVSRARVPMAKVVDERVDAKVLVAGGIGESPAQALRAIKGGRA